MKKKKIVSVLAVTFLAAAVVVGTTVAYLTANSNKQINTVSVGYDSVEIVEDFIPPKKQESETIYKKKIQVRNNGTVPCYARVYVDFSNSEVRDVSWFSKDGINYYSASRNLEYDAAYINHLPEKWKFIPDNSEPNNSEPSSLAGYFYYTDPLDPDGNDISEELFTFVKTIYPDNIAPQQYDIIVYAESIQTIGENGQDNGWYSTWSEFLE